MLTRRTLLSALPLFAIQPQYKLIAHRGGVVGEGKPENSRAALETAKAEGYWMAEVDIRQSKDGEPVLYHDAKLGKYHATTARAEDLTWKELAALSPKILHFEEACALCEGRLRLMLDLKGRDWPRAFYTRILKLMEDAKIPHPIYSLGGPRVLPLFDERVMVSINPRELAQQEVDPAKFFVFDIAESLNADNIGLARKRGLVPVAAINTFRYTMAKRDEDKGPAEDFAKLKPLGVQHYQIDSRYSHLFV
ncbi:MAG: glycerophosphodiester phosphodiesterase family protein [Bryobacter sp.]|nr:glycerophosphodiester phosphodiesterase family protein [Bryobacter sp.]